jgi:6-phosphogluconate dehydrogenase (decarboxylating)
MSAITSAESKLGFVGIGYMGRPIAQRLLNSGFKLTAYDRHRTKAEELVRYGGAVAENVAELSSHCDVVLSCLASDEAVLNIYKGADGAFANARRGALVIDLSTVSPQTSQELSRLGSERGISVLDVTISGSTPAAEQGALILFGGGGETCFAAAESIFRVIARKIWPRAASHHPAMRRGAERAQALFGRGAASHHPGRDAAAGPNGRGHYLAEGRVPSSRTRSNTRRPNGRGLFRTVSRPNAFARTQ